MVSRAPVSALASAALSAEPPAAGALAAGWEAVLALESSLLPHPAAPAMASEARPTTASRLAWGEENCMETASFRTGVTGEMASGARPAASLSIGVRRPPRKAHQPYLAAPSAAVRPTPLPL